MKALVPLSLLALVLAGCVDQAQTATFEGCSSITPLSVPASETGTLDANDCKRSTEYTLDYYEVSVAEPTLVTIRMHSDAFAQSFVSIYRADSEDQIDGDVQDPGTAEASIQTMLDPGTLYIIAAAGLNAPDVGAYTLSVDPS